MEHDQSKILATGIYLPERVVTNVDLEKQADTTDKWIFERTGIRERRISSPDGGEFPSDMAAIASRQALERAGLQPNDIDLILFASWTPDYKLPNSASMLQHKLGISNNCGALDIDAACSGFVYGMNIADSMVRTGAAKNVLLVGSEMVSREVDWTDRSACIIFGDGAGAAIISAAKEGEEAAVLSTYMGGDSSGWVHINQKPGASVEPLTEQHLKDRSNFVYMNGRETYKVATRMLAKCCRIVLDRAGLTLDQVDWIIPHQANLRILETTAKLLEAPMEKIIINIEKYGNTSAATIPIALDEAVEDGRVKRGDVILFNAFGAGFTFGATLIRF